MYLVYTDLIGCAFPILTVFFAIVLTSSQPEVNLKKEIESRSLGDDQDKNVDSLVNDLQNKDRGIFAVGYANSKLLLFISGSGSETNPAGGYTVQVNENKEGNFEIAGPLGQMPSGIPSDDSIKFVCSDSVNKLVVMSSSQIGAVSIPGGGYEPTKITTQIAVSFCFDGRNIHLSSNEQLFYYTVNSSGGVIKFCFGGNDILSSIGCTIKQALGFLCTSGDHISVSPTCQGSPIFGLTSGCVGSTAYLFDTENTVYVFDASAFTGQSVKLKKITSKEAWKGKQKYHPVVPDHDDDKSNSGKGYLLWILLVVILLIACAIGIGIYCFCKQSSSEKTSKDGNNVGAGKKKDSKGSKRKRRSKSSSRGGKKKNKRKKSGSGKSSERQGSSGNTHKISGSSSRGGQKTLRMNPVKQPISSAGVDTSPQPRNSHSPPLAKCSFRSPKQIVTADGVIVRSSINFQKIREILKEKQAKLRLLLRGKNQGKTNRSLGKGS